MPAWAWPMSLRTIPKPAGVRKPRFSLSAICQIYGNDKDLVSRKATRREAMHLGIPHLSEHSRVQSRLVEEPDCHLAGDNTDTFSIGLSEKLSICALLLGREIQVWLPYCATRISMTIATDIGGQQRSGTYLSPWHSIPLPSFAEKLAGCRCRGLRIRFAGAVRSAARQNGSLGR
jgi:hypothetical protein